MKLGSKEIYYKLKDHYQLSERKMAYVYGISGIVLASIVWWIF